MAECPICCEETKGNLIECNLCGHGACSVCIKTNIGMRPTAACIFCKHDWSYKFLYSILPNAWLTSTYKKQQQQLSVERQKALLPGDLPLARQKKEREERRNRAIIKLPAAIERYAIMKNVIDKLKKKHTKNEEIVYQDMLKEYKILKDKIINYRNLIRNSLYLSIKTKTKLYLWVQLI